VQNVGRATVEDVELLLNFPPGHFDIWPQRQFTQEVTPNNNLILKFDNLNPREHFTVSVFQVTTQPPLMTNLRWRGGVGRQRLMAPQQVLPPWFLNLIRFVFLIGVFAVFYLLVRFVQWMPGY